MSLGFFAVWLSLKIWHKASNTNFGTWQLPNPLLLTLHMDDHGSSTQFGEYGRRGFLCLQGTLDMVGIVDIAGIVGIADI